MRRFEARSLPAVPAAEGESSAREAPPGAADRAPGGRGRARARWPELEEEWQPELHPGQLVLRAADDAVLKVLALDRARRGYLLEDGSFARPDQVEDPLRASYRHDLERGRQARQGGDEERSDGLELAVALATLVLLALLLLHVTRAPSAPFTPGPASQSWAERP
ncbi:MAG: hypothetical protein AB7N76_18160 [Planctomycetota bacterium]